MPVSPFTPRLKASGFTLVELLVSLAVAATVVALALFGMRGLGEQRDARVCASHLRQVYLLVQSFVADHNGRFPPISADPTGDVTLHWRRAILPYMGLDPGGSGMDMDVYKSKLICPSFSRREDLKEAFKGICSFGLNTYLADPAEPKKRGIPVSSIRRPAGLFFATETIISPNGLPKEAITPIDINGNPTQWGRHRDRAFQNVMFADGHIEFFEDVTRLKKIPYGVGREQDVWTP
ncbi:MAG TPA: prepilin-type N-terminal cleavage/methylation domain-containing protein [Chthoniobacteraceae bacterium]|nr:prepilin-type N-terminal cleavage/methylation domain-containing protein [Chthoniobacteraceae bacterium]